MELGAKKGGRYKRAAVPGPASLQCCLLISPKSCPHTSSAHHNELLFHQLPEPPSASVPLIHRETLSFPLQNLLRAFRTCGEQLQMLYNTTLCVLLNTMTQLSTQHTNPGIMLITKSFIPTTSSSLKIKEIVQEAKRRQCGCKILMY